MKAFEHAEIYFNVSTTQPGGRRDHHCSLSSLIVRGCSYGGGPALLVGLNLLGRASPSKRAGFHVTFTWEKASPPTWAGSLSQVTRVNYIHLFYHETRNPIFTYKFSFYNLHINKQK